MGDEFLYSLNPSLLGVYKPCFLAWWMAENKCQGYLFPCQPLHYCIVLEHQTHYQSEKRMPVFPFSLLLMEEWIMFPIVRRWNAQRHPAPETKVSPISHLGLQDSWMTRYHTDQNKSLCHTRQSDALNTPVKMICPLKNSVVHFVRKPLSTVILAQKRTPCGDKCTNKP